MFEATCDAAAPVVAIAHIAAPAAGGQVTATTAVPAITTAAVMVNQRLDQSSCLELKFDGIVDQFFMDWLTTTFAQPLPSRMS
ncbi:MAG: hypothetical protein ACK5Y1_06750 [Betaproteobacteria bacterium]|jgi:hypothetical protein